MTTSVRFCLSYDPFKWDSVAFKMNIITIKKRIVDTDVVYDFYDLTLSIEKTATSYDKNNYYVMCLGYVDDIDAMKCAIVSAKLGAGRSKAGDSVNHAVGLELKTSVGKEIKEGRLIDIFD